MKSNLRTATSRRVQMSVRLLILIALVVNAVMLMRIHHELAGPQDRPASPGGLPCAALPTRFVLESPECAQKLLEAMNVTNVRVHEANTSLRHVIE
jgi:hypothetical protein